MLMSQTHFSQVVIRVNMASIAEVTVHTNAKMFTVTRLTDCVYMAVLIPKLFHRIA